VFKGKHNGETIRDMRRVGGGGYLQVQVHIYGAIETTRPTSPHPILAHRCFADVLQ